jgi:hypothetical protein
MLIEQAQAQIERIQKKYHPNDPISTNDLAIIRRLKAFITRQRAYEVSIRRCSV